MQLPNRLRSIVSKLLPRSAHEPFQRDHYQRHNQRRLEHLASLGLDLYDKSVLEVGAGIGDHTHFFRDRGCRVVSTDARAENVAYIKRRYPGIEALVFDLTLPENPLGDRHFDIVYCYGTLYHLSDPLLALDHVARHCSSLLLMETCVSRGDHLAINPVDEAAAVYTQAMDGTGCRPTRPWVYAELRRRFAHVYLPYTQPSHEQFPLDWTSPKLPQEDLVRSVFIASRQQLNLASLSEQILMKQTRR